MTHLPTLQFSTDNTFAKLLDQVVALLLGLPPTVVHLHPVVVSIRNAATGNQTRMTIMGGYYGHA